MYDPDGFRVAPLSNWLALIAALGLQARQVRHNGLGKMLNLFDVIDGDGVFVTTIIRYDLGQHSRWSCNVNLLRR